MATQVLHYTLPITRHLTERHALGQTSEPARDLIGVSNWAKNSRKLVALHAAHLNPLILEGEPGTGKSFLSRLIHRASRFKEGPFVSLDLGEASDQLAREVLLDLLSQSETDAIGMRGGGTLYFEEAAGNESRSLFDAVVKVAKHNQRCGPAFQFRILIGRATRTEHRGFGSARDSVDCETLRIPSLRFRPEDIEPLVTHFIDQYCQQTGRELRAITPDAMDALRRYDWPRNISELKTLVNLLVSQAKPPSIDTSLLPAYMSASGRDETFPASGVDLAAEVERYEVSLIRAALRQSRGRQNTAARLLQIKPTTLFMKLRRYSIEVEDFKPENRLKTSPLRLADRGLKEAN